MLSTKQRQQLSQNIYRQTELGKAAYARAQLKYMQKYRWKLKQKVLAHYSDFCCLCGEQDVTKLSIDHIAENGREHREQLNNPGGYHFYRWLIKNNFPEGYQTLCLSCNSKKWRYGLPE